MDMSNFIIPEPNALGLGLSVLFGAAVMAAFMLLLSGLSKRAIEIDPVTGERRLESSGLERILSPLGQRLIKQTNRDDLARQLRWARSPWSPELYRALPLVALPAGATIGVLLAILINSPGWQIGALGIAGAGMGYMYPQSKVKGALRKRSKAIARDVPAFISYYARIFSVQRDMSRSFQEMNRRVQEHKRFFDQRGGAMTAELRRRIQRSKGKGPYDSDLWANLEVLAAQAPHGIVDPNATVDRPDPLVNFATESGDPDLSMFVNWLREASIQSSTVEPSQLDNQVEMIRDKRYKEQQREIARMVLQATGLLVIFNLPLLMMGIMAPVIYQFFVQT